MRSDAPPSWWRRHASTRTRRDDDSVRPGYHQNKRHWNTVELDGTVEDGELGGMIDHSYELVVSRLPRSARTRLLGR